MEVQNDLLRCVLGRIVESWIPCASHGLGLDVRFRDIWQSTVYVPCRSLDDHEAFALFTGFKRSWEAEFDRTGVCKPDAKQFHPHGLSISPFRMSTKGSRKIIEAKQWYAHTADCEGDDGPDPSHQLVTEDRRHDQMGYEQRRHG